MVLVSDNASLQKHDCIDVRGFLKIDESFIQKTQSGLYIVQGLNFGYTVGPYAFTDEEKDTHHKMEVSKENWFVKTFSSYSRHEVGIEMMLEIKDIPREQIKHADFYVKNLKDRESVKAQIFYPTDEVLVLYK